MQKESLWRACGKCNNFDKSSLTGQRPPLHYKLQSVLKIILKKQYFFLVFLLAHASLRDIYGTFLLYWIVKFIDSSIRSFVFFLISRTDFCQIFETFLNKPERVFGLQVRCRELDVFKIFLRNFLRNCLEFFLDFLWNFLGIFKRIFLGRIFLEEFFWRIFWEDFFWRIFLGGILCLHC